MKLLALAILAAIAVVFWLWVRAASTPEYHDDEPFTPFTDPWTVSLWERTAA